ncbi:MAG: T9SS type A sorting domain-containing protein [Balneolaceae bacterium]
MGEDEPVLLVGAPGAAYEGNLTGSVYIYQRDRIGWNLVSQITHEEAGLNSYFGVSLASNSIGEVFVGASRTNPQTHREAGSVFKYQLSIDTENPMLHANDNWVSSAPQSFGNYGAVVSASDEFVLVSSPFIDRDNMTNAGQVHFYSNLVTSKEEVVESIRTYELFQNYPNPFNPSTVISYQLPVNSEVQLEIFDLMGRKVATLLDGEMKPAGKYDITFDARRLASGMYIYRLKAGNFRVIKKLTLIK